MDQQPIRLIPAGPCVGLTAYPFHEGKEQRRLSEYLSGGAVVHSYNDVLG